MARFCTACGTQVKERTKFCSKCGAPLAEPASVQPQDARPDNGYGNSMNGDMNSAPGYNQQLQQGWFRRNFWTTEGRLNRWAYFTTSLKLGLITLVVLLVLAVIGVFIGGEDGAVVLAGLGSIPFVVASYFISARRLHDLDKTGWLSLIFLIPYVNVPWGIYLLFAKGTEGPNQYGPDPLQQLNNR